MPEPLEDLFAQRSSLAEQTGRIDEGIAKEAENKVLSVIYLSQSILEDGNVDWQRVVHGVQKIYDERFRESDVYNALKRLIEAGLVQQHTIRNSRNNFYNTSDYVEFKPVPALDYSVSESLTDHLKRKREAPQSEQGEKKPKEDEDSLPF